MQNKRLDWTEAWMTFDGEVYVVDDDNEKIYGRIVDRDLTRPAVLMRAKNGPDFWIHPRYVRPAWRMIHETT